MIDPNIGYYIMIGACLIGAIISAIGILRDHPPRHPKLKRSAYYQQIDAAFNRACKKQFQEERHGLS